MGLHQIISQRCFHFMEQERPSDPGLFSLTIPHGRTKTFGDAAFSHHAPAGGSKRS